MTLRNLLVAFFAIVSITLNAQVSKISYKIKFNEQTNLFDCYLLVKEGQAISKRERAQFNAQYTIKVPTGSKVKIHSSHNPIQANQQYDGTKASQWFVSNIIKHPEADPSYDFISINPTLAPASFYNNLKEGDEIKLFSLNISPITECGSNVKIFENGKDLNSSARGMGGGDFSNGFTIGSPRQSYAGNETHQSPTVRFIQDIKVNQSKGIQIEPSLMTGLANDTYKISWTGPGSFQAESPNISISKPTSDKFGKYKLLVTDSRGCQDVKEIEVKDRNLTIQQAVNASESSQNNKDGALSTSDKSNIVDKISLYPNPATTNIIVNVNGDKGSKVVGDIVDIHGKVVIANAINKILDKKDEVFELSILDLQSGIYSISLNVNGSNRTKKFMVIK